MSVPYFPRLWGIGLLMSLTRWTTIFLGSYLVFQLTHSTPLVQMVGAAMFAPMFFGGLLAGVISDRLDRRRTMMVASAVLMPASLLMAFVVISGFAQAWMVYPFTLAVGTGLLIDMTSRRPMVYDIVGPEYVTNALALEAMAMTSGALLGSLFAGTVISVVGIGETFLMLFVAYSLVLLLLRSLPTVPRHARADKSVDLVKELITVFRYVRGRASLISILGVTIIMNTFYFSFIPLLPIFGERLGVGAFLTGLLLSSNALGWILGSALVARGLPVGRGAIYVVGSSIALIGLLAFAASNWYPAALIAIMAAGLGLSGFSTMQSVLVMTNAEDEMRGRAVGILSMSIGVLPFAMLLLGGVAQVVGPSTGVMASAGIGLFAMVIWSLRRPEARGLP